MARSGSLLEDGVGEVRHKSASVKPEFGRIRMLGREIDHWPMFLVVQTFWLVIEANCNHSRRSVFGNIPDALFRP